MVLLLICQVLAMTVWFSSTAALPQIVRSEPLSDFRIAAMTSAVQIGFVVGTLVSAGLRLPDRVDPRALFLVSAVSAGVLTAGLATVPPAGGLAIGLRVAAGVCLAGVYPIGLRIAATWASGDLGWLMGLLVGALTLGSASPHLVLAATYGLADWRWVYLVAACAACASGLLITQIGLGPRQVATPRIALAAATLAWRSAPMRLANLGYLGHMWELYALWAWIGAFFHASFAAAGTAQTGSLAGLATFAVIGAGALGAGLGGICADRVGRTATTMAAMAGSASCALVMGWLFAGPPVLLIALGIVWGITVIADSAQFSASIAELSDPSTVGTMLTIQTSAGFFLTLFSIQLMGPVVATFGWPGGFSMLAVGPILGCWAMARLRTHPAARTLAGGLR
ncbi:MFS transporter [Pseudonocardia bannensis]|uniref:MFS transporter n=1 Tax=Pseudonocardia bannensis TaxID=630973 RepID=UPI001B7CE6F1|nr:MFS transporter [Pseudonocardia bannensis]